MTREQQLDWLCRLRSEIYVYMPQEWIVNMDEALTQSIKALSQEPCEKCEVGNPCLYCEHEFSQKIEPMRDFTEEEAKAYSKALDKMYKPTGFNVFDEPCEEIDFVQEHKKIPVTLDLTPCDDAISREDALMCLTGMFKLNKNYNPEELIALFSKRIKALPPVTQKSGKWIEKDGFDGDVYYDCSVCGESWTTIEGTPWDNGMSFCPNCGAKMVEPQESEEE